MRGFFASLLALFVLFPSIAAAETINVRANRISSIAGFWVYAKQNCHHTGKLKHRIASAPKHGKVTVSFERRRIPESVDNKCAGRMSGVMVVHYTPNRGYRGKDSAAVTFEFPQYLGGQGYTKARTMRYTLNVK
ncbi:MAG: hypothetical protein MRY80_16960 [Oricola sp.]|nr:hypothetical protein [Oricola sp.]